ncbi:MAG: DUF4878 domain-containing protein [Sphingobacteriales bacterium]|jgi:hypothetical protein|nr:DUF4878 domain-containing protein [Sphingobacteriales bacterium]OJW04569.1 MAG: hypothetical protein BGO52_18805 [Sphingobacteriales bacterium 44-61]
MKKTILSGCVLLLAGLLACKNAEEVKSENAIDAARNFIQSALNGEFDKASQYMVDDSLNRQDLHLMERLSKNLTTDEKQKYKEASIRIHETRPVNDSATVIYYSNSYKNKRDSLKVVNQDGQWLVDFKYIFKQGIDSLP